MDYKDPAVSDIILRWMRQTTISMIQERCRHVAIAEESAPGIWGPILASPAVPATVSAIRD